MNAKGGALNDYMFNHLAWWGEALKTVCQRTKAV
jgi:hypothetical protein